MQYTNVRQGVSFQYERASLMIFWKDRVSMLNRFQLLGIHVRQTQIQWWRHFETVGHWRQVTVPFLTSFTKFFYGNWPDAKANLYEHFESFIAKSEDHFPYLWEMNCYYGVIFVVLIQRMPWLTEELSLMYLKTTKHYCDPGKHQQSSHFFGNNMLSCFRQQRGDTCKFNYCEIPKSCSREDSFQ